MNTKYNTVSEHVHASRVFAEAHLQNLPPTEKLKAEAIVDYLLGIMKRIGKPSVAQHAALKAIMLNCEYFLNNATEIEYLIEKEAKEKGEF